MASFCKILLVVLVQVLCWIPATRSECLNNGKLVSSSGPWNHGAIHYGGHIVPNYVGEGPIRDWTLTINFTAPLAEDLETWNVLGFRKSMGKSSVVLTAEYESNERINKLNYHFNYIAAFKDYQWNGHLECVQFCGILDSGENTCDLGPPQPVITTTSPPPVTTALQTGPTIPTTPYVPSAECGEDVLHIDGGQDSEDGRDGFINAHWLITAPKRIKYWKLTFTTDAPFTEVTTHQADMVHWVGDNTYRFKNNFNTRVILKGRTLRVGWTGKFNGPRPKILSAIVTSWSLPEDLILCQAPMSTAAPEATTAAPEETTAAPETTTAAPEETTAEPEATTAAPEATTAEPEATTAAPEETTAKPEATTAEPEVTTAAPETNATVAVKKDAANEAKYDERLKDIEGEIKNLMDAIKNIG